MRTLVLSMGMSLDGFVALPGRYGAAGWGTPPEDPAYQESKLEWVRGASLHLMGRATYEEMAGTWPVSDHPYAAPMNEIPKVVFSHTLERADWDETRIASGELADEVATLRAEADDGYMIAWGGAAFAQSLAREGLVDEYRLTIQPVGLGDGKPLFRGLETPVQLALVEATIYDNGTALHIYKPR